MVKYVVIKLAVFGVLTCIVSACVSTDYLYEDVMEGDIDSIIVNYTPLDASIISNSIDLDSMLISDTHSDFELTKLFQLKSDTKNSTQGFAILGDELFNCHHSNDIIDVYNLITKDKVSSIILKPDNIVHCNNVNFSSVFYDNEDKYPILYIQQRGYANKLNVYRIISENDNIISAHKIQEISFSKCSFSISTIDSKKSILYVIYGYNGNRYLGSFRLPSVKEGDLTISIESAYKTYYLPFTKIGQDTAFYNNCLFLLCGYKGEGELWRIDLDTSEADIIDLPSVGFSTEPEGIDIYGENILLSSANKTIYSLYSQGYIR